MKILVTGGAGFIGAHLARTLIKRGDKITIIDNFNGSYYDPKLKKDRVKNVLSGLKFNLYKGDIRDEKYLDKMFRKEKFDKVVHLAGMAGVRYSLENPLLYEEVNVRGTLNMLEASKKYKVKNFVYASSSSVYGNSTKTPFSESDNVDYPVSHYAATKKATELLAHVYSHVYGMNTSGLRFFTVYGPWGRPDMAYFKFANLIYSNKPIEVYNHGNLFRDNTYIDDIIAGIIAVLDANLKCEVINIGGSRMEKLSYFIKVLEKNIGITAKKIYKPLPRVDVLRTEADVRKLKKLGWKPTIRIETGLKKFVEWYKDYYKVK